MSDDCEICRYREAQQHTIYSMGRELMQLKGDRHRLRALFKEACEFLESGERPSIKCNSNLHNKFKQHYDR